jgi:hypothetical protein
MSAPAHPHLPDRYETLYGVHFLDDLHNYFPALLYDSSSFQSVQGVLRYIQEQTRARFDLFSYGQREYLSTNPAAAPSVPVVRRVVRSSLGGSVPEAGGSTASTLLTPPTLASQGTRPMTIDLSLTQFIQSEDHDGDNEDEEEALPPLETALSRALLNLLQIPPTPFVRGAGFGQRGLDQFLQPVEVRPTPEQIAANTTVGNLVSDTDHSCAICQDTLTAEQEGRKLNACGHWFHKACIDTWLNGNVHCPVCRHDIREPAQAQSVD